MDLETYHDKHDSTWLTKVICHDKHGNSVITEGRSCNIVREKDDLNHDKHDSNGFTQGKKEDLNNDRNARDGLAKGKAWKNTGEGRPES
eukprot:15478387-Heterocapsa_arctica.AAC.1